MRQEAATSRALPDGGEEPPSRAPFGIPRPVWFLGLAALLNDTASEAIYPLLPLFLTTVLGAGAFSLGVIEGGAEAANSLLKVFSGYFSDRWNRRRDGRARRTVGGPGGWLRRADRAQLPPRPCSPPGPPGRGAAGVLARRDHRRSGSHQRPDDDARSGRLPVRTRISDPTREARATARSPSRCPTRASTRPSRTHVAARPQS